MGDCWNGIIDPNYCAKEAVKFLEKWRVDNIEYIANHDEFSAAYTFVLGGIIFMQTHNYPLYDKPAINIKNSLAWLDKELAHANNPPMQPVIINMHDSGKKGFNPDVQWDNKDVNYRNLLNRHKVAAIMAGHIHSQVGFQYNITAGKKNIPVFHNGSAEYNYFTVIVHNQMDKTIKVMSFSSRDGVPVRTKHGNDRTIKY